MRKNWSRRAEKSDPDLKISLEIQKVDKDVLDIARHRLSEVLKEAGMDGSGETAPTRPKSLEMAKSMPASIDNALIRQSAATEAARKQAEQVSKQLLETQKMILEKGLAASSSGGKGDQKGKRFGDTGQPSNRQRKTQKWFEKGQARREEQAKRKEWNDRRY